MFIRAGRPKAPVVHAPGQTLQHRRLRPTHRRLGRDHHRHGLLVAEAIRAAEALEAEGVSARVIDMYSIKPLDRGAIERAAPETGAIVVAEEHLVATGLGVRVAQVVAETRPCPMEFVGIQDTYAESGTPQELMEKYGLVAANVVTAAKRVLKPQVTYARHMSDHSTRTTELPCNLCRPRLVEKLLAALSHHESTLATVSRQLHDDVSQVLSAVGLQLDAMRMDFRDAAPGVEQRAAEIQNMLEQAIDQLRDISNELNPSIVERAGLHFALERLSGKARKNFPGTLRLQFDSATHVPTTQAKTFYKIAECALDASLARPRMLPHHVQVRSLTVNSSSKSTIMENR